MGYDVIEKLSTEQIQSLYDMYQSEWWTKGRELSDVQRMVEHSDVILGLCDSTTQELVGFTRVLTDYVYKAFIFDVIVKETHRGKDFGRILMDRVLHHPSLINVKHFELYCRPEMLPYYKKWGFTEDLGALYFMRRVTNSRQ